MHYVLLTGIECGIPVPEFWELDLSEVNAYIEVHNKKAKEEAEGKLRLAYTTSAMTASFVNRSLNGKQIPSYESIFNQEQNITVVTEQLKAFADSNNRRRQWKSKD